MSRGLGRVERAILSALADARPDGAPECWHVLAAIKLAPEPHSESRRRAAASLARKRHIETMPFYRWIGSSPREYVHARLRLDNAELAMATVRSEAYRIFDRTHRVTDTGQLHEWAGEMLALIVPYTPEDRPPFTVWVPQGSRWIPQRLEARPN